jgi:hypothetical protein
LLQLLGEGPPPGRLERWGHYNGGESFPVEYSSSSISIVNLCESL